MTLTVSILFLVVVFVVADLVALYCLFEFIRAIFFRRAVFVSTRSNAIPLVAQAIDLRPGQTVVDLGSGSGQVLFALARIEPRARYIGYETGIYPYFLSRLRQLFSKLPVTTRYKNFYKADLRHADRVYMYLLPNVMDALLPKLEAALPPGARVVSCDFQFSKKEPVETIELHRGKGLSRRLFVYEF